MLDGLKIVLDCANGAAYNIAPKILWELGAEVVAINVSPDGTNVNKNSGSTYPDNLINKVLEIKADVGIALDGDADRCILVDENGILVDGDKILAIIANQWKKNRNLIGNTVVGTVMTNQGLENYFKKNGINLLRTDVGDKNIIEKIKTKNLVMGGEPSGHIILNQYSSTGDGILASLEVLGIMKMNNKKLSTLSSIYKPYPQVIYNYVIKKNQSANKLIKKIDNKIKSSLNKKKVRLVIRKSGTENKVRIMSEAEDLKVAKNISEKAIEILNNYFDD